MNKSKTTKMSLSLRRKMSRKQRERKRKQYFFIHRIEWITLNWLNQKVFSVALLVWKVGNTCRFKKFCWMAIFCILLWLQKWQNSGKRIQNNVLHKYARESVSLVHGYWNVNQKLIRTQVTNRGSFTHVRTMHWNFVHVTATAVDVICAICSYIS